MSETARLEGFDVVSSSPNSLSPNDPPPKELTKEEVQEFIKDYSQAARNALEADNCNTRTDEYGGSVENRSRFFFEVVCAVVDAVGPGRVGVRLSPWQRYQGMRMEDPIPEFTHVISELKSLHLAYLHLTEARVCGNDDSTDDDRIDPFVETWGYSAPVILAGGFKPDFAESLLGGHFKNKNILVAFGRYFISNPDLPFRIYCGLPPTPYDRSTFYMPMATEGYADYRFSQDFENSVAVGV
ncbi:hypothetical protein BDW62DRAFT_200942 [Aspergillus aurantiobrunneus]